MGIFQPQNPGIGIFQLTLSEEEFLTTLANLSYVEGDILKIVDGIPAWVVDTGGGGTWGSITGTLSDQIDIQTVLNGLVASVNGEVPDNNGNVLLVPKVTTLSTSTAVSETMGEIIYLVDATSGEVTITLPSAVDNKTRFTFKKIDSSRNRVIILCDGVETIDDDTINIINYKNTVFTIISDSINWRIIN